MKGQIVQGDWLPAQLGRRRRKDLEVLTNGRGLLERREDRDLSNEPSVPFQSHWRWSHPDELELRRTELRRVQESGNLVWLGRDEVVDQICCASAVRGIDELHSQR